MERSVKGVKKRVNKHTHYGQIMYRYGICDRHHYTKLNKTGTKWRPCPLCNQESHTNREKMKKRREHMAAKARLQNRQVPSFLRDELDRFEARMELKIMRMISKLNTVTAPSSFYFSPPPSPVAPRYSKVVTHPLE